MSHVIVVMFVIVVTFHVDTIYLLFYFIMIEFLCGFLLDVWRAFFYIVFHYLFILYIFLYPCDSVNY